MQDKLRQTSSVLAEGDQSQTQLDLGFQQFGVVLHSFENPHPLDFLYFAQIDKWLLCDVLQLELASSMAALSFD